MCYFILRKEETTRFFAIAFLIMMIKQLLFLLKKVLGLFKADIDEKSYEYDQVMDKKFAILRDEIKNLILKSILTKEKAKQLIIWKG